jgi:hypothetical protein
MRCGGGTEESLLPIEVGTLFVAKGDLTMLRNFTLFCLLGAVSTIVEIGVGVASG